MNILCFSSTELRKMLAALAIFAIVLLSAEGLLAVPHAQAMGPSADLDQAENGGIGDPAISPVNWVNGNVNKNNGHFVEGESIPYKMEIEDLTPGVQSELIIGFDLTEGGNFAIDYITSNDRIDEVVDPCSDTTICSGAPTDTGIIPAPTPTGNNGAYSAADVTASFNALVAAEGSQVMKIWNGVIDSITYTTHADISQASSEAQVTILFTPSVGQTDVVFSWGGHIGSALDYPGLSAGGVNGSSYHTRLISIDGGGGNQDRSLSANAVTPPGNLIVVKQVINDNGGTAVASDFTIAVAASNTTPVAAQFMGNASGTPVLLDFDTDSTAYSVTEVIDPNYAVSYSADCAGIILSGETKTCTITNDDIAPSLTLTKVVSGGPATTTDFELTAAGPVTISDDGSVVSDASFEAGTYTLSEVDNTVLSEGSYSAGVWSCTGDVTNNGDQISIGIGQSADCSITNTYVPPDKATLHIVKELVQDNGGTAVVSDFTFNVSGDMATTAAWVTATATYMVDPGTYSVAEDETATVVDGRYAVSYDSCSNIVLAKDDVATCTITNDDIAPELTVVKTVVNDDNTVVPNLAAEDFTMNVSGVNVSSSSFAGSASGIVVTLDAGDYSVDEVDSQGYTKSLANTCSGSIDLGEQVTCTITNDDPEPDRAYITVVKTVVNDDGRTLGVSDFPLFVDQTQVTSGVVHEVFATGTYTISEANDPWYTASDWGGDCAADGTLTGVVLGSSYTCTITNDDIPGSSITIDKVVTGEQASDSQSFSFSLTGATSSDFSLAGQSTPETFTDLAAGTYTFAEGSLPDRWALDDISCVGAASSTVTITEASSTVAIALVAGENVTCTYTNEYTPQDSGGNDENIVVQKVVTDGSDTDTFFDFEITQLTGTFAGATTSFSLAHGLEYDTGDLAAGEYYSITESLLEYWSLASTSCETSRLGQARDIDPVRFEVRESETITCIFTNDQQLFQIFGYVWEDTNEDGVFDEEESPLSGWEVTATNGSKTHNTLSDEDGYYSFMVPVGTWTITETLQSGWEQTFPSVADERQHVVVVPYEEPFINEEDDDFLTTVFNFFIPTAHAQAIARVVGQGPFNFGNVQQSGGGGGSKSPSCKLFTVSETQFTSGDVLTLTWDTSRGTELVITANGTDIFTTTDNTVVSAGTLDVTPTQDTEYELTVYRNNRSDSCEVSVSTGDSSGPTPQVLGEQVSVVPVGGANTGAGGSLPQAAPITMVWLAALPTRKQYGIA